ncbi:hypothetical protein WJX81_002547 [Elliptochloris bilobata]|uniref:Uncharacterized protein n=1 Tax=Elliptochloris bilobata TaxID=381761 RepID=A0AAW1SAM7_9CHLO
MSPLLHASPAVFAPALLHGLGRRRSVLSRDVSSKAATKPLTQKDMCERIKKHLLASHPGVTDKLAADALKATIDTIMAEVAAGQKIQLTGFGTFQPRARPARQARNPKSGEVISVAATTLPAFTAGKKFKDAVKTSAAEAADPNVLQEV